MVSSLPQKLSQPKSFTDHTYMLGSKTLATYHKKHLEDYWPKFLIGLGLEAAGYLLFFNDDMMTWLIGLKTMVTTTLWLSKQHDGRPVR